MRRLVLLQCRLGHIHRVHVCVGAPTIEAATGLNASQVAKLFHDDRAAIEKAMRP